MPVRHLVLFVPCLVLPVLAGPNLLPDGGFEQGTWELTTWMPCRATHELAGPAHAGEKAVHLVGIEAKPENLNVLAISQPFKVQGGREYLVSVWYRTAGAPGAMLGWSAFREPFATAKWKTPSAQYENDPLPNSDIWWLGTWRLRAGDQAVEACLLVRLGGVGEVWYDDAGVVEVVPDALRLSDPPLFEGPGRVTLRAAVKLPAETGWTVAVLGGETAAEQVGKGTGEAQLSFAAGAGDGLQLVLTGDPDGGVVAALPLTVPPPLEIEVVKPRYRQTIFATSPDRELRVLLRLNATPAVLQKTRSKVTETTGTGGSSVLGPGVGAPPGASLTLTIKAPGRTRIQVSATGPLGELATETAFTVLPRGTPHEVYVDDQQRLRVDGKPFFARGFYGVPDEPAHFTHIAEAGYNTVLTYNRDPAWQKTWLDHAAEAGLMGVVSVPFEPGKLDADKLRAGIGLVKGSPGLLGYYLIDEPSPARPGQSPQDLQAVYDAVVAEDPYHPVTICIDQPALEGLYTACSDILMIDPYVVLDRRRPLSHVADRMEHAWSAVAGRQAVINIPQTFGWDVIEGLDKPPSYLTPTPDEMRSLWYLALAGGARGMLAYCYHVYTRYDPAKKAAGGWPWTLGGYLPDKQPVLWGTLKQLGQETQALEPWLMADGQGRGRVGEVQERRFELRDGKLHLDLPPRGTAAVLIK
ncbi:MAG: hypothetical protein HYU66_22095 [Armatimonadetes bacterium]|nr:hypothetical protein [Armatimonadota bacterium]